MGARRGGERRLERKTLGAKIAVPVALFGIGIVLNVIGFGVLGLTY
jgi:hypothetical protein